MPEITITREETGARGRYAGRIVGIEGQAELTYQRKSPKLVVADHTFAPDALRSTGAARALVERLIADARAEGFRIVPKCPYVKAQFERHPEWAELHA